jgi:MOSC domain-containing protein YiiM
VSRFAEAARALEAEGMRTGALGLDDAAASRTAWGDWTIKDVLGHLESSHRGLLDGLRGTATPLPGRTLAQINEQRRQARLGWPLARVLAELDAVRGEAVAAIGALTDDAWARVVRTASGREWKLWLLAWQLSAHERDHRLGIEAALGRPGATRARVDWLNVSNGGVPKLPIHSAELTELGLVGDAHRKPMHGGPTAALCLYSLEVIHALQAEGHPIYPGAVGENVTIVGLDWSRIQPGDRLRLGPTLVEITRYTTPCVNVQGAFKDGQFARILVTRHPGESRAYARVIETGRITVGDPVDLLPSRSSSSETTERVSVN